MNKSYKIDKITLTAFRGISYESTLDFKDITILCGENGTGKSSFVNAFEYAFSKKIDHLSRKTIDKEKSTVHHGCDKKDMSIKVDFSNGKSLRLKKTKDDELKEILDNEYIKNASFILNRKNLLKFIDGTQSKRYEALMELCGFKKLIKQQSVLSKTFSNIENELTNKNDEYNDKKLHLSNVLVADDSLSYDESLNELNTLLKKNNLHQVDKSTNISQYLMDFQVERTNVLKEVIKDFNIYYDNLNLEELDEELNLLLKNYERVIYDNFKSTNDLIPILEKSSKFIGENDLDKCPICESDIDSNTLVPKMNNKINDLKEKNYNFTQWKNNLNEYIVKLKKLINILDNLDAMVVSTNEFISESVNLDDLIDDFDKIKETIILYLRNFSFNKEKLQLEELSSNLFDLMNTGEMIDYDKYIFKNLNQKADILKDNLFDYYELTSDNTELLVIYDALLDLDKLNELNSQIGDLKKKKHIAKITFETFKESKEKFINQIINDIKEDIKLFYEYIHGDDEITAPDIQLTDTNFVDVYLKSFGENVDPRSYASEGHLDSLGLCIFLAFNKEFNPIPFIVLDDVIATVDMGHKEKIARLLIEELVDNQVFITTHSKLWEEQLRRLTQLSPKQVKSYEIISWNVTEGPIFAEPLGAEEKIEKYLSPKNYDLNAAGNTARRYLEYMLKQICRINRLKLPYVDQPDLNSMFTRAMGDTRSAVKGTPLKNFYDDVWKDLDKQRFMANVLSHDNINFDEVSYAEVKSFCDAVINLRKAVTCEKDGYFLIFDKQNKKLRCTGAKCKENMDMDSFFKTEANEQ